MVTHSVGCFAVAVGPSIDKDLRNSNPSGLGEQGPAADSVSGVTNNWLGRGYAVALRPRLFVRDAISPLHVCSLLEYSAAHMSEDLFLTEHVKFVPRQLVSSLQLEGYAPFNPRTSSIGLIILPMPVFDVMFGPLSLVDPPYNRLPPLRLNSI